MLLFSIRIIVDLACLQPGVSLGINRNSRVGELVDKVAVVFKCNPSLLRLYTKEVLGMIQVKLGKFSHSNELFCLKLKKIYIFENIHRNQFTFNLQRLIYL